MSKNLKLTRKIKGTPEEVYLALTNPFTIQLWTDEPAVMDDKEGTEFSIMDGAITGRNIEMQANKLIRQIWYFGEEEENHSEVTIRLEAEKSHTNVFVEQVNIPEEAYENILEGWKEFYLGALREFFEA
jgi:activator of HSP90 ATPase